MSTATVEFAGIELLSPCPHCSAPMAVNTLTDRCRCSSCLMESALPPSVWEEALRGVESDVVQFGAGYLRHGPVWGEAGPPPGRHVEWLRGHDAPPCPRCQQPMRLAPQGGCICPGCGAGRAILPRPPWLPAHIPVLGFVSDEPAAPERPREPVHVSCTQCGGPLVADGSSRIVSCGYCSARVALSDAVWAALHPPRVKKRWWLAVHVAHDPRRAPAPLSSFQEPTFWAALIAGVCLPAQGVVFFTLFSLRFEVIAGILLLVVSIIAALWLRGRWLYDHVCRPEHEVVGRLVGPWRSAGSVEVLLTKPCQPAMVLARVPLRHVSAERFAELGGEGGRVRAWMVPGRTDRVHVEAMPSALE